MSEINTNKCNTAPAIYCEIKDGVTITVDDGSVRIEMKSDRGESAVEFDLSSGNDFLHAAAAMASARIKTYATATGSLIGVPR